MYVAGSTNSPNFPTKNPYDATFNRSCDTFVAKIGADGRTLLYSTYLGGSGLDEGWSIAVDTHGQAYVSGLTTSRDFPTTPSAFDRTFSDGMSCEDPTDCSNAFVVKLNARGNALVYSTYLGGSKSEAGFIGARLAVDGQGNAYITGRTGSPDFPTTPGAFDRTLAIDPFTQVGGNAFVTKINTLGTALVYPRC